MVIEVKKENPLRELWECQVKCLECGAGDLRDESIDSFLYYVSE